MDTVAALMTAHKFAALPPADARSELILGKVVEVPPPGARHGLLCNRFARLLGNHVADHGLGEVLNESGVITSHNPDSVRGSDLSFSKAARLPPIDQWTGYFDFPPDLVVEVRSPNDHWSLLVLKAGEYLAAGVVVVVVLNFDTRSVHLFEADQPSRVLGPEDVLTLPGLLGDFAVRVGLIFE